MIEPGQSVGHIRIEEHLAAGAMGDVFVGFDQKLQRRVAVKAVHGDLLDARSRARHLAEARILSQLDHPNVCRIHGYLEGEEGDFLVLELIRGRTLRQALQDPDAGLDPRARLKIAEQVARALAAAHEKGIVHRDLKPENVMLTEAGEAKVLDFGVARLEAAADVGAADVGAANPSLLLGIRRGAIAGTASSMSPEQARGETATASSDVYSLGLLLQELFTGRPPYELELSGPLLQVKAAEGDMLPVDEIRDPDLAALLRQLKALAPEARPTAAAAADRLAWIRGKPGRRRRRLLAVAVAMAFVLGGVKYTLDLWQEKQRALAARRQAEQEAARAEAVARFLEELFRASDPRQARGEPPSARELLRRGTERLGRELEDQPLLRARLLDTLGSIHAELGLYDEARPLLEQSLAIRQRLLGGGHLEVADTLAHLGRVAARSGQGDAVPLLRRALAIRRARLGPAHPEVAELLNQLGIALAARGRFDGAEALLRLALALEERLWEERGLRVARALHNLSGIASYRGRADEAAELLERALAIREAALPEDDLDLAGSREALALQLRQQGRMPEAEQLLERVAATAEKVYGPEHPELARTLMNLGLVRSDLGREDEARQLAERALAIGERALAPDHPRLVEALLFLASMHADHGRYAEAEPLYLRALAVRRKSLGPDHPLVGEARDQVAQLRRLEGRPAEAEALYQQTLEATRQRLAADPGNPGEQQRLVATLVGLGLADRDLGRIARAEESWREAVEVMTPSAAGSPAVALLQSQALALLALGRVEEARPLVEVLEARGWQDVDFLALCRQHGLAPRAANKR